MMKHLPKLLSVILLLSLLTGCDNSRPATTVPETTTAPTTTVPNTTVAPTTVPKTTAAPTTEPLNVYCDLPEFTPATDPTTSRQTPSSATLLPPATPAAPAGRIFPVTSRLPASASPP